MSSKVRTIAILQEEYMGIFSFFFGFHCYFLKSFSLTEVLREHGKIQLVWDAGLWFCAEEVLVPSDSEALIVIPCGF